LNAANGDIALHINPRFDIAKIIMNSQVGGQWGDEIVIDNIGFQAKNSFHIRVDIRPDQYEVTFFGHMTSSFFSFSLTVHRCNFHIVSHWKRSPR
jgi:hypothetical protein